VAAFVLIPGAGGASWEWHLLAPELERLRHTAVAVDLPAGDDSAGWAEYADVVVEAAGGRDGPVLVAQSLAGFTAPMVCERIPVSHLVLLNAMIPRPGETGSDWWSNTGQGEAMRTYLTSIGVSPEAAKDDAILYFHDVPPEITAEAFRRNDTGQSMTPMREPWPLTAWPDVPTRVLAGRDDRLFPLTFQRRVARERLGLEIDEIDGGHLVALSRPRELAARLDSYARA
jgi:pimeloyl-ACP methyl ester carboxylesterase